jgi:hypothetical protein
MPDTNNEQVAIAIYSSHKDAEAAIKMLRDRDLDLAQVSIAGRDFHREKLALGFYTMGQRFAFWGGRGALWGSLSTILVEDSLFLLPGIGAFVAMGPLIGSIVKALDSGATSVIARALAAMGIPAQDVTRYESELVEGKFLVLVRGTSAMIAHARAVFSTTDTCDFCAQAA